jgi:hypothetical protein
LNVRTVGSSVSRDHLACRAASGSMNWLPFRSTNLTDGKEAEGHEAHADPQIEAGRILNPKFQDPTL